MYKRSLNKELEELHDAEGSGFSGSGSGSGDYYDDEEDINEHAYFIPLCVLAGIILLVNTFMLILVWRNVKLRSNCNALLVSLAAADGTTGLVGIPLYVVAHLVGDEIPLRQTCFMLLSLQTWVWFMAIVSIFHLLIIACEQYLAILKPFSHDKIVTKTSTTITLAIIWLVAIGHSLIPWTWILRLGDEFCDIEDKAVQKNDTIYIIFSIATFFVVPIAIMFYVYYRIVSEAKRQLGRIKRESVCSRGKYPYFPSCTRFRGFYIIAFMWLVFIICWAPYFGAVVYETFRGPVESFVFSYKLTVLRFLPSVLNPIMFAFWRSDFRAACIEKFCCCVKSVDVTRSSFSSGKQHLPLVNRENRLSDSKPQSV